MKPNTRLSELEKMKANYMQQAKYWEAIAKELRLRLDNSTENTIEKKIESHIHYYAKESKHCKSLRQELIYRAKIDALEKLLEEIKEK